VLAIDTSSALSSIALVDGEDVVGSGARRDPRRHVEELGPLLAEVRSLADPAHLDAIACGVGPGPYTGLRVGVSAAIALGVAWGVPVVGVCSLDAVAAAARAAGVVGPLGVAADARRREVYWAWYDAAGARVDGPRVGSAAQIDSTRREGTWCGAGAVANGAMLGRVVEDETVEYPRATQVALLAGRALAAGQSVTGGDVVLDAHGTDSGATADALRGRVLLPPRPLYLRRPDVTIAGGAA
jgi:tRNA threonylcarbamoyl adenosine modification protein YeaZ